MRTLDEIFDWSDITADTEWNPRSRLLTERGGDVFFFIHHAYNRRVQDTIALSKPGGKQVSENAAIGPTVAGAAAPIYAVQVVPWNSGRAFTTASSKDDIAFTTEVSNLDLNSPYPVAQAAKYLLAEIAAALHVQTGMPLDRWHICDHAEVYARGWQSYATACCGADLRAAIDWIIETAKQIVAAALAPDEEEIMQLMQFYKIVGGGLNGVSIGVAHDAFTIFENAYWRDKLMARYGLTPPSAAGDGDLISIPRADLDDELRRLRIDPATVDTYGWNATRTPPVGPGNWSRVAENAAALDAILKILKPPPPAAS